jgi:phosphatidylserine/phosphatidylglycerophosphate/cardiolipin synthase-like enzyme
LDFNSPAAFRELLNLDGICVYVHPDSATGFHAKGYIFGQDTSTTAIVGSSNLTERALLMNHEWNLRFSALPTGDIVQQLNRAVKAHIEASVVLTKEWIDEYELTWLGRFPKTSIASERSGNSGELSSKEVIRNRKPFSQRCHECQRHYQSRNSINGRANQRTPTPHGVPTSKAA